MISPSIKDPSKELITTNATISFSPSTLIFELFVPLSSAKPVDTAADATESVRDPSKESVTESIESSIMEPESEGSGQTGHVTGIGSGAGSISV